MNAAALAARLLYLLGTQSEGLEILVFWPIGL